MDIALWTCQSAGQHVLQVDENHQAISHSFRVFSYSRLLIQRRNGEAWVEWERGRVAGVFISCKWDRQYDVCYYIASAVSLTPSGSGCHYIHPVNVYVAWISQKYLFRKVKAQIFRRKGSKYEWTTRQLYAALYSRAIFVVLCSLEMDLLTLERRLALVTQSSKTGLGRF